MAQALKFDDIKDSCSNLTTMAGQVDGTIDTIDTAISKIANPAWEGKASKAYREKLTELANNLPDANRQLALSVVYLASCADAYEQLGNDSVKKLKELIGGQEYIDKYDVNSAPEVDLNSRIGDTSTTTTTTTTTETPDPDAGNKKTKTVSCGGCGGCGSSSGDRYTYTVGDGLTSSDGTYTTNLVSSTETTSSLTNLAASTLMGQEIALPTDLKQSGYTVTGYDYWINSGKTMEWEDGTNQKKVSDIWKDQGSVFKNGIAVINVDGVDRYLVAVTTKFGQPGDCIDVKLSDGTIIPCIIGDSKGDGSGSGSEWGHSRGDGSVNVLEFEVQRTKFLQSGNPTTEKWNLPWNDSLDVKSVKNLGSIIGAKKTEKQATTLEATPSTVTSSGTVQV